MRNETLYSLMVRKGYPESFSDIIATELRTDFTSRRMIGYIAARDEVLPLDEVADEMMAILSDRERLKNKHIAQDAQSAINEWYRTMGEDEDYEDGDEDEEDDDNEAEDDEDAEDDL